MARGLRNAGFRLLLGMGGLGLSVPLLAEEGVAPPPPLPAPKGGEDAELKNMDRRKKEKTERAEKPFKKNLEKRAGEPERDPANAPGRPPGPGGPLQQGLGPLQPLLAQLNVVDRAALGAALALLQAGQAEEAQAAAEKVAEKSPDPEGAGVARLLAGRMQLERGEPEKAAKTLRSVTGRAAPLALASLCAPLAKAGDTEGLLAAAKDLLAAQKNGLDQCRVVKALLDLLSRPGPGMLPPETRARILGAAAAWIPYETALAAQEALAKDPPLMDLLAPPGPPPGHEDMRAWGDMPPDLQQALRELRNLPPDQRKEGAAKIRAHVEERLGQLKEEGRGPEAERLKEILDRLDERMKGPPAFLGKGPRREEKANPEELRAQIKHLEELGRNEEANKLKQQLEIIERPAGEAMDKF